MHSRPSLVYVENEMKEVSLPVPLFVEGLSLFIFWNSRKKRKID